MKKYFDIGFNSGYIDASRDYKNNKLKNINYNRLKSLLYDIGYIIGYVKFLKLSFKNK